MARAGTGHRMERSLEDEWLLGTVWGLVEGSIHSTSPIAATQPQPAAKAAVLTPAIWTHLQQWAVQVAGGGHIQHGQNHSRQCEGQLYRQVAGLRVELSAGGWESGWAGG